MEQLYPINVGQQANDGTGDPLRNGMETVNDNFASLTRSIEAIEGGLSAATVTAYYAKDKADAAVPASQKGMAGGVAPLDASGKVPTTHLPMQADYIPVEEKGAAGGVAPLDAGTKVPVVNLPVGTAGGVAPLDAQGKVPAVNLPAAQDSVPLSEKGEPGGVATLDAGGKVPGGQLPPIPSGPPVASIAWWPLRTSIPAGQIPADGQIVSRATFPDLAAMVTGGKVPVVTEADWLADPLKRGSYTVGDGSTTIRLPDLNGQSSGALAAVFLRGDGAKSVVSAGILQRDQLGPMIYRVSNYGQASNVSLNGTGEAMMASGSIAGAAYSFINQAGSGSKWIGNTGDETRPTNVSGVWTIQAFGAVTNPGSADAAQLASDYAALNAAFQTLNASFQTLQGQVFGVNQSLQNVRPDRSVAVTYTNSTGRPIVVYVSGDTASSAGGNIGIYVNGDFVTRGIWSANGIRLSATAVVPPGATYLVNSSSISLTRWEEYR